MIEELATYIRGIQEQYPLLEFINEPVKGLHIMLEVKDDSVQFKKELYLPEQGKEGKISDFLLKECLPREVHIDYIESHKALIGKEGKKIHSASPFALKIRKKSFDEDWKNWFPGKKAPKENVETIESKEKVLNGLKGDEKRKLQAELIKTKIKLTTNNITELLNRYFERANKVCSPEYHSRKERKIVELFQKYCIEKFPSVLDSMTDEIVRLSKDDNIIILLRNMSTERYESANSNYLKEYIFNVDDFNRFVDNEDYGLSGYLNTASDKKPFLKHCTAPFDVNTRIPRSKALLLHTFEQYRQVKALKTTPLPIFIDHKELNYEVINVIKNEGHDVSFHEIIFSLFKHKKTDLGNYYLFYFSGEGELKDLDFVSSFDFDLNVQLQQIIPTRLPERDLFMKDIFQFEDQILLPIFNNQLIQKRKNGSIAYRYFDEIKNNPKYITAITWILVMKYRKAFYDFIYKSRSQSVTNSMFHSILREVLLDDIRRDEYKDGKHTKAHDIYTKLNIWFSLWNFFGSDNKKNDLTMANKIVQLKTKLRTVQDAQSNEHLQSDEEFAFTAGQIIYFLLSKSKAASKSHALLEPFLQKTDVKELKRTIVNTFNAYKHEIDFGKGRFETLCGEIMAYEVESGLKDLIPYILAGYFSDSVIYEQSKNKENGN